MTSPRRMESTLGMSPHGGQRVMTRDGHELGTVKEVEGDAFKVNASMKRDYWLSFGSVLSIEGERVVMDFDEEMLESYQLDGPDGGVVSESPIIDAESETFTSTADKDLRRERNIHPDSASDA